MRSNEVAQGFLQDLKTSKDEEGVTFLGNISRLLLPAF